MSGDRLAEKLAFIEQMANQCVLDLIEEADVLALVEIAKAARACVSLHTYGSNGQVDPLHRDLARALARLDRPSSDGTADSGAAEENT